METTHAIILILVSVAAIASIIAALKTVECNGLKDRCAGLNSDNERLNDWWQAETDNAANLTQSLKVSNDKLEEMGKELAFTHEFGTIAKSEIINLQTKLTAMKNQHKEDIDTAYELYNRWQATRDQFNNKYHDLIAMPRRKRDKLIAEIKANLAK